MSGLLRLFVAADLGPRVAEGIARAIGKARLAAPNARWVAPEGVHLTLAFLGAVAADRVPGITAALQRAAARHRPIDVAVEAAGTFGRASSPRVLWLGVTGDVEALIRLQRDLASALEPLGFPAGDRAFRPHLTLARARDPRGDHSLAGAAERLATTRAGAARVDRVLLMRSELGRGGARYSVVDDAPLGGASG